MAQFRKSDGTYLPSNNELFEVVMIAGGNAGATYIPTGNLNTQADAFGRQRISQPYTLFDSNFRFSDNTRNWRERLTGTASSAYNSDQGLMDLTIGTASGDEVVRQSSRTFPYQPGKSLLVMNTFTLAPAETNLRQRVGYFTRDNGVYLEQDDLDVYMVKRSAVSGSIVDTPIAQADWNIDKLDGTGPSGVTLDLTKSQILWSDFEWLGVGSVRTGFVINGQFIPVHIFHHANEIEGTYITTASLSCRYELTNTGTTSGATMKQICSTVISEGGYISTGLTRSASNPITGYVLGEDKDNPVISLRLRSGRTDAIAVPREISLYGLQNTAFKYKLIQDATINGGTWSLTDSASSVEYNITADSAIGGTVIFESIFKGQATVDPILLQEQFGNALQLTRDIIEADSVGNTFTITIQPTTNNDDVIASVTWQEQTS